MIIHRLTGWLETLRFPVLVVIAAALFLVNLVIPDPLPFIDEILLALGTVILARFKRRKSPR